MFTFENTFINPKRGNVNSRADVDLTRKFPFGTVCPVVCSNMSCVGTLETARILSSYGMMTCLHKYHTVEEISCNKNLNIIPSVGIQEKDFDFLKQISPPSTLCIDAPNGYIEKFYKFCEKVRKLFPKTFLIAGNVITSWACHDLMDIGIDCIKVGIASGSYCTTKNMTGVWKPQLQAVYECSQIIHRCNKFVMSDGGVKEPSDMCKLFVAGADFVMAGTLFAGHCENGILASRGRLLADGYSPDSIKYEIYGMASKRAMELHKEEKAYRWAEGKSQLIDSKGSLHDTINMYLAGLRSCCTYIGVDSVSRMSEGELYKCS